METQVVMEKYRRCVSMWPHLCRSERCRPSSRRHTRTCCTPCEFLPRPQTPRPPGRTLQASSKRSACGSSGRKCVLIDLHAWNASAAWEIEQKQCFVCEITSLIGVIGGRQTVDELWQTQLPVCVLIWQLDQSVDTQGSDTETQQPSQWNHKPYLPVVLF